MPFQNLRVSFQTWSLRMMIDLLWLFHYDWGWSLSPYGGIVCDNQKCHAAIVRCRWLWLEMHKLNGVWARRWTCIVVIMHWDYYIIRACPMVGRISLSPFPYNTLVVLVSNCLLSILAPPLVITIISSVSLPLLFPRTLHCHREIEVILCIHLHAAFSCWRDVVV